MASFLYRLGRAAYRRRWWFVSAWAVVLLAVGLAAGAFMGTLSNTFSLPGTETQQTLDKLKREMPELAGGTGSVVYRTADGAPFTEAQRQAVAAAISDVEALDDVASVTDPFALQSDLDTAEEKLDDARRQLADGRGQLADGKEQLEDGKEQLADGRRELADGKEQLAAGKTELEDGRSRLEGAKAQLAEGQRELSAAKAQLADGRRQLAAGRAELASGQGQYDAGSAQIADGKSQLAQAREQLAAQQQELAAGRQQYEAGATELMEQLEVGSLEAAGKKLAESQRQLEEGGAELDRAEAAHTAFDEQIAAVQADGSLTDGQREDAVAEIEEQRAAQVEAGLPTANQIQQQREALEEQQASVSGAQQGLEQLNASKKQLDAGGARLAEGADTLAAKARELAAGERQLAASEQKLDSGAAEISANQRKLDAAAAKLAAGERDLAQAAALIRANEAKLAAGEREIAANEQQLADGERTLEEKAAQIPDAERELADAERQLADGEEELTLGERRAASTDGLRFVSQDGTTAAANLTFTGSTDALTADVREQIKDLAGAPAAEGVEVFYSKEIVQDLSSIFGIAEIIGIAVAAVVLFVMLGTLVAAGLPLLMAVLGVGAGVGATLSLSSLIDMASITPALALMLGLAVGIDYSLFIVHRHRRQLLEGMDMEESIGRAIGTSGNAVVFAGLTVVIALAALAVPGLPFLAILGLSAAFTVAMAVAMALTLTPAMLAIIGTRLVGKRAWARAAAVQAGTAPRKAADPNKGWGGLVTRRPWTAALASVLLLGVVALPAIDLRTALPDGSAEPNGSSAKQAYEIMSDRFGGGYNGPILVVADLPAGLDETAAEEANLDVADAVRAVDGVVAAVPVGVNDANTVAVLQVIPQDGPASAATEELVHSLRDAKSGIKAGTGADISVTGQVAGQIDVSEKLAQALPPYLVIVVGLSLVLMLLVFRSVVVPLLATAGFLLSLVASFGATVAVYQWGWLGQLLAVETPGPIMSFLPILLTGILFGLAMDYQVFLVSAMRESFAHGEDARSAVRSGFRHAAPVVTAAALIMGSVFAGFVFSHLTMIRAIGFSLAVGVLFDAFVVRMTLTPAIMQLLGRHAWYIPRWLDRILPDVDVEGAKLDAAARGDAGRGDDADADADWFFDGEGGDGGRGKATVDA